MDNTSTLILPIAERHYRKCNTCVWYRSTYEFDYCIASDDLQYSLSGERSDAFDRMDLTWLDKQSIPCRFHTTPDELKMILDPYYME